MSRAADMTRHNPNCRIVLFVPVLHTRADMGDVGSAMEGRDGGITEENAVKIREFWTELEREIEALSLDFHKVRLYQDSLPVCGQELRIVSDLARNGSVNHRLLLHLVEKGATLMGTESAALLLEEYRLIVNMSIPGGSLETTDTASEERFSRLLRQRDREIAARIDATLQPGETGILFIGMLHAVEKWLTGDISVLHPFVFNPSSGAIDDG